MSLAAKDKHKVCVVIPLYKPQPNEDEKLSLQQCVKVLHQHDLFFVCPEDFDTTFYKGIAPSAKEIRFDNNFFASIEGYNRLLLSTSFYSAFNQYKYIFLYQLDAYIFKDELLEWCNKGYDYIGAPWVNWFWSEHHSRELTLPRRILKKLGYKRFNLVGNGGLSLRKVNSCINNLKWFSKAAASFVQNEDYFFSLYITSYNPFFRIPRVKDALAFSFDENPEDAYRLNHHQLPMACHAWPKYKAFWKTYIHTIN